MFQTTSLPWDLSPSSDSPTEQEPFDMVYTPRAKTDTDVILLKKGYEKISHISDTLQGAIYSAKMTSTSSLDVKTTVVVIKQTSRDLHSRKLAKTDPTNGEMRKVTEDILKEVQIMQAIDKKMPKDCIFSNSMVKYYDFFETDTDYFLVMEHGGSDLFDFIVDAHLKIKQNKLRIRKWRKYCKYLLWQMSLCLFWLHTSNICHLDISLENLLVSDAEWFADPSDPGYYTLNKNVCVKFCDFGLAEMFDDGFVSSKYCGKLGYLSPQIAELKPQFMANKCDIWSLGIVFFAMAIGAMPYSTPDTKVDKCYEYLINGRISDLFKEWKCLAFVSKDMLDLMKHMLTYDESERYDVSEVIHHQWFCRYYEAYKSEMFRVI